MSNSNGGFEFYGNQSSGSSTERVQVDWAAMNQYVVDTVGCKTPETVVGVVAQIVDLGLQEMEDARFPNRDDEATRDKNVAEGRCYYEEGDELDNTGKPTGKTILYKRWEQKPVQQVALVIDFPDIIVDKGQFFGDSKPLPYRMVMGGLYWDKIHREMVLQRPVALRVMKNHKDQWSLSDKNTLHRMAVAADLIETGGAFTPNRIGELLGKPFLFEIQAYLNGRYFNERIKLVGKPMRGMPIPEYKLEPAIIGFNQDNDPEHIKELRREIIATMARSVNWEGSKLKEQVEAAKGFEVEHKSDDVGEAQDEQKGAPAASQGVAGEEEEFDTEIPF